MQTDDDRHIRVKPGSRPVFIIELVPSGGCQDPARALRAVLKNAGRNHSLQCIRLRTKEYGQPTVIDDRKRRAEAGQ